MIHKFKHDVVLFVITFRSRCLLQVTDALTRACARLLVLTYTRSLFRDKSKWRVLRRDKNDDDIFWNNGQV